MQIQHKPHEFAMVFWYGKQYEYIQTQQTNDDDDDENISRKMFLLNQEIMLIFYF